MFPIETATKSPFDHMEEGIKFQRTPQVQQRNVRKILYRNHSIALPSRRLSLFGQQLAQNKDMGNNRQGFK
jgi:hypothetical protein